MTPTTVQVTTTTQAIVEETGLSSEIILTIIIIVGIALAMFAVAMAAGHQMDYMP